MTAQIIDGKAVAAAVRNDVKEEVTSCALKALSPPRYCVSGRPPDSMSYVTAKRQACAELGIESFPNELPETVSQADVLALVNKLSAIQK